MQYTANLNLKKPIATDYYDIEHQNGNMDILDTEIQTLKVKPATAFTGNEVANLRAGKLATGDGIGAVIGMTTIEVGMTQQTTYVHQITLPSRVRPYTQFWLCLNGFLSENLNVGIQVYGKSGEFHVSSGFFHKDQNDTALRINTPGQWITRGITADNSGNWYNKDYVIVGAVYIDSKAYHRGIAVDEDNKNLWHSCIAEDLNAHKIIFTGGYIASGNLNLVFKTSASAAGVHTKLIYKVD